ncbi:hypothetical protein [Paenibacillus lutimineralis]|uniref:Uncharacterized protein n=1 Tax=Paenibacillus lutimineralis TaxID=2707005 RepID=A0A3Q9I5U6_9BACL|nr:hypothetical protein [Paenibacillus lutimineralis]AZS13236.1 hypothetical protein EI981_01200 [Paenibacillus lutimineralis]
MAPSVFFATVRRDGRQIDSLRLDLVLFLFYFMLNMYLFAKYTDSVLFREGVVGFAKALLKFLFAGALVLDIGVVSLGTAILLASWALLLRRRARILALTIMNTASLGM